MAFYAQLACNNGIRYLFVSLFINITAMSQGVNLKDLPILESLGYVFVPLLSYLVLKEKFTKRMLTSIALILIGIYISIYNE